MPARIRCSSISISARCRTTCSWSRCAGLAAKCCRGCRRIRSSARPRPRSGLIALTSAASRRLRCAGQDELHAGAVYAAGAKTRFAVRARIFFAASDICRPCSRLWRVAQDTVRHTNRHCRIRRLAFRRAWRAAADQGSRIAAAIGNPLDAATASLIVRRAGGCAAQGARRLCRASDCTGLAYAASHPARRAERRHFCRSKCSPAAFASCGPTAASDGAAINEVFVSGLRQPFGIAFYPNGDNPQWVYVANTDSVVRFPYRSRRYQSARPRRNHRRSRCRPAGTHPRRRVLQGRRDHVRFGWLAVQRCRKR